VNRTCCDSPLVDCGGLFYTEEWVREQIANSATDDSEHRHPLVAPAWVSTIPWLGFNVRKGETERERLERSVQEDVVFLRNHPLLKPTVKVTGWYYNLATGIVEPVEC
jgi:carbonic anhydrase